MKKDYLKIMLCIVIFGLGCSGIEASAQKNGPVSTKYQSLNDISYYSGTDQYATERCKLDLYYPTDISDFTTVVWFHGGGLTGGNKSIPKELKSAGLAVVAVNYRLLPHCTLSDCIDDAARAVAWVMEHIASYGGNAQKIVVSGHSAGGYLTNMIGLDKKWLSVYGKDANQIALLAPFSGHAISHFAYRKAKGMKTTQPSIDEYAPLFYVRKDASPLVIISGDREQELLGRYEETAYLWRMMKVNGHKECYLYELDGFDHAKMTSPGFHILKSHIKKLFH